MSKMRWLTLGTVALGLIAGCATVANNGARRAARDSGITVASYYFGQYHPNDPRILNINCWNEWTEGSYLEPDTVNGMGWTMHYYSNVARNYGCHLTPADTLDDFPGLSTVYKLGQIDLTAKDTP